MAGMDEAAAISPAKALLIAVREYLDEHYPHWTFAAGVLPAGLRLEMHPRVRMRIMTDAYAWDWPPGGWAPVFGVPVKVTTDLPDGTWRLAVITEDVLLGGKL